VESREAVFIRDAGGLLDNDGALQQALRQTFLKIQRRTHPTAVFIAERMVPRGRRGDLEIAYIALPAMTDAQVRQLGGFLLTDAGIAYSNEDLDQVVALSDGHPFNVKFIVQTAIRYTLPVALADTTDLAQWKARRGAEFLRKIHFSTEEAAILSALRDFPVLDFATIQNIVGGEVSTVGAALSRLMDLHAIEGVGDTYQVAPPLRAAVGRDNRFALDPESRRAMLKVVSDTLKATTDDASISVSMIDAGILAILQEGAEIPAFMSAFLLPSHLVWLARRHYAARRWSDCARLAAAAILSVNRMSPAGRVEACRLLCLSSARLNQQDDFRKGIDLLRTWADDSWARSNVYFLIGFNARLDGNYPLAEENFRKSQKDSPGNFQAIRELAGICLARGELAAAEMFARKAFNVAPDNSYILDILLKVLIDCPRDKLREREPEIELLFQKLQDAAEEEGRSFYATRRAQFEFRHGSITEACRLIDTAAQRTPAIFDVHLLRAQIYLERGIKAVVSDEIEKMRRVVYRESVGERRSNIRSFLEIEASYLAATGDFSGAKKIYENRSVFSQEEAQREIRIIEYEQAMRSQKT
jgi:tetratricopeptide (TPR) repeat protein